MICVVSWAKIENSASFNRSSDGLLISADPLVCAATALGWCIWQTPPFVPRDVDFVLLPREPTVDELQNATPCFSPRWMGRKPALHLAAFLHHIHCRVEFPPLSNLRFRNGKQRAVIERQCPCQFTGRERLSLGLTALRSRLRATRPG